MKVMWCDLPEEERKDCDSPCVLWYNGKFAICDHWHEGKGDRELSVFVSESPSRCSYSDVME